MQSSGYGVIGAGGDRLALTHRVAWESARGHVPAGLCVCHRCDNPPCCNPAHLFLGTHADNMADMAAKGRQPAGEDHPHAKLSREKVAEIRAAYATGGVSQGAIARRHGVSRCWVSRIVNGHSWRAGAES